MGEEKLPLGLVAGPVGVVLWRWRLPVCLGSAAPVQWAAVYAWPLGADAVGPLPPVNAQALSLEGFSGIEAFLHVERLPRLLQLTLTGCGYFSPLVAQLTSLTCLELEQCDTDSLPAGLSDLRHLQELVAEGGRLGGVSAQVRTMIQHSLQQGRGQPPPSVSLDVRSCRRALSHGPLCAVCP